MKTDESGEVLLTAEMRRDARRHYLWSWKEGREGTGCAMGRQRVMIQNGNAQPARQHSSPSLCSSSCWFQHPPHWLLRLRPLHRPLRLRR